MTGTRNIERGGEIEKEGFSAISTCYLFHTCAQSCIMFNNKSAHKQGMKWGGLDRI
jgi:hypothetical protein